MKSIKSFLLIAAIAFSSVASAHTNPDEAKKAAAENSNAISQQVGKLLKNPTFDVEHDMYAKVELTINKNNEIVVLSVDSEDGIIEGYIKGRLNYSELPVAIKNGQRTFIVPVKLEANFF